MIEIICFEIWLCARHCLKYLTCIQSFSQENTKIQGILICNLEDKGTEIIQFTEGHKESRWQSPNSSHGILAYHFSLRWVSKLSFERVNELAHLTAFREYEKFPSSVLIDKEAERERWGLRWVLLHSSSSRESGLRHPHQRLKQEHRPVGGGEFHVTGTLAETTEDNIHTDVITGALSRKDAILQTSSLLFAFYLRALSSL